MRCESADDVHENGALGQHVLPAELLFFKRTVHSNLLIGLCLLLTFSGFCLAESVNFNKEHWSFIPPKKTVLPEVQQSDWVQNEIDVFTLFRMEKEGLLPSPKAGAATLIRRLSLDLTGLPPDPNQVRQFVNNPVPETYSRVVDHLLASPRFGEHFALPWLEIARYADTHGYQNDGERDMWRWRDWVVDALNRNLPYDQFTVEQLAGDLLPDPTLDQIVATGFNRNHRYNSEGGSIQAEFLVETDADRVDTTGTTWLGLTLGCARCHDHKYDPISQKDYYRFFAFFHNIPETGRAIRDGNSEPYIKAPTFLQQRVLEGMEERIQYRRAQVKAMETRVAALQHDWENRWVQSPGKISFMNENLVAHFPFDGSVSNAVRPERDSDLSDSTDVTGFVDGMFGQAVRLDGSGFIDAGKIGNFQNQTRYSISLWIRPESISTGILLSRMNRTTERRGYQLMLQEGKVVFISISRWIAGVIGVRTQLEVSREQFQHIAVTYDGSMSARGIQIYIGGKKQAVEILYNSDSNPGVTANEPFQIGDGPFFGEAYQGAIDDLRLYQKKLSDEEIEILAVALMPSEIAQLNPSQRSRGAFRKLRQVFLKETDDAQIRKKLDALYKAENEKSDYLETLPTLMVMKEMPIPRKTYLLKRGQYDQHGERVEAGIPEYFPEMPSGLAKDRLGLARWLVNPENPLTARVTMNRFWQHLFGTGLVKT
ncbi:MAG TPA: DUF1549 domain-containing protein, partial [Verrucomicrobia bacterium]|nr:DUF1549 domain-containing protein [Verrucomicrobiota bacterium]